MISRTHDVGAFASLLTALVYFPPASLNLTTVVVCLTGNIVGSLLPDIDQASNRLWDLIPGGNSLGRVFRKLFLAHRTISHSFLGVFLIFKFLWWFLPKILNSNSMNLTLIIYSIMIGFISHLLLDFFTEEGLPLLFPFKIKMGFPPISPLRIKTGKGFEKYIVFPAIIIYSFWLGLNNQDKIVGILKLIKF